MTDLFLVFTVNEFQVITVQLVTVEIFTELKITKKFSTEGIGVRRGGKPLDRRRKDVHLSQIRKRFLFSFSLLFGEVFWIVSRGPEDVHFRLWVDLFQTSHSNIRFRTPHWRTNKNWKSNWKQMMSCWRASRRWSTEHSHRRKSRISRHEREKAGDFQPVVFFSIFTVSIFFLLVLDGLRLFFLRFPRLSWFDFQCRCLYLFFHNAFLRCLSG